MRLSTTIAPSAAPTPIPVFAPPLKPEDVSGAEDGDACEPVSVTVIVLEVLRSPVERSGAEAEVVRRDEEGALDSFRVAVLADERMVVIGVPTESSRNLPTPVSQQSFVWSQQ